MKDKINIAELLKDCPTGMELDSTLFEGLEFDCIVDNEYLPIRCRIKHPNGGYTVYNFTKYGCWLDTTFAKCVIFPKGKTTWEGFVSPCKYKAGDVLVSEKGNIVLLSHVDSEDIVHYHCIITTYGSFIIEENTSIGVGKYYQCDLANEQQRQRMYDRIKSSGYKYNQHINKLEKLVEPKFKIGDKVSSKYLKNYEIEKMEWDDTNNRVIYKLRGMGRYSADELQLYKEETMDKANKVVFEANAQCCDISNKIIKKETMEKEISSAIVDRFICLEGYYFYDDKGNIIDTKEIIMKKKQPKYPNTYEECCEVLWHVTIDEVRGYKGLLLDNLQMLLICRDAYWKLAGDWKPDWNNDLSKYYISFYNNKLDKGVINYSNKILAFPTEEMRDAFYENFKELIKGCKELL